jgi:hypothetical protein
MLNAVCQNTLAAKSVTQFQSGGKVKDKAQSHCHTNQQPVVKSTADKAVQVLGTKTFI